MDAGMSSDTKTPDLDPIGDDGWRHETDLGLILQAIRRASNVYVCTDFGESLKVSRNTAIDLLNRTRCPVYANICSLSRISVFIHAVEDKR